MKRLHRIALSLCLSLLLCVTCSSLFSVKASAATTLIGSGSSGNVQFDLLQGLLYCNNRSSISKDGVISITADTSSSWANNAGSVNIISLSKIDFTNVQSMSIEYELLTFQDLAYDDSFGFGLLSTNDGSQMTPNWLGANASIPVYDYGVSGKALSSPLTVDTSDVQGEYFISFGFITSYISSASGQPFKIKFTNLILNNSDGSTTVIDDLIYTLDQTIDNVNDQIAENFGALGFAHDTLENFINLFNEEPPAPVITVPPLKMKIDGVEHQFFNGYQYDFRDMETGGLSVLVGAARTAGTLVLWWAFLQYCLKEFNSFFGGD